MYSFDGQYKFGLHQSLGGASKKVTKSSLIESAKQERLARENHRKRHGAALKLQAHFRGFLLRSTMRKYYVTEFDSIKKIFKENNIDDLEQMTKILCLFFKLPNDFQRLVFLCQHLLKYVSNKTLQNIFNRNPSSWVHRIKVLLLLACRSLQLEEVNISIPLRMLEVFTAAKTYSFSHASDDLATFITIFLVSKGYFANLRVLINKRVPSSLEPSPHPPTPFAAAAKDLVLTPIRNHANRLLYKHFALEMLLQEMSEQICYFIVPAISSEVQLHLLLLALEDTNQSSIFLLYSLLMVVENDTNDSLKKIENTVLLISVLEKLIAVLKKESTSSLSKRSNNFESDDSDDDESENMEVIENASITKPVSCNPCLSYVREKCLEILNSRYLVNGITAVYNNSSQYSFIFTQDLCGILFHLLAVLHFPVHKHRLMYTLAFNHTFLRQCWKRLYHMTTKTNTGKDLKILHQLSHGGTMCREDQVAVIPMLGVFTTMFRYALFSIYDSDFYDNSAGGLTDSAMPFTLSELVEMSSILKDVIIGLIYVMHPDVKSQHNQSKWSTSSPWQQICQMGTQLVKHLYGRDCRHRFCPENHWLSSKAAISHENLSISTFLEESDVTNEMDDVFKQGLSTLDSRGLSILKYIPFAVPFLQRVRIFQRILAEDKKQNQSDVPAGVYPSHNLNITVNRKYLYQDAYDQLSKDRAHDIKRMIRVQMINAQGLDEAGIDGGGVFREFMSQLMRTGFDPSYGFFKTTSQQLLYPNPDVGLIQTDFLKHLHFLGRMLGKIIYESMMVELPLADFFLCKLLNRYNSDVDIYHLESLDPELYRNLFNLKSYDGNMDDLALNFTVVNSDLGETRIDELKPGGKDIPVTSKNKIEYIHLMADYRLNKQIRSHCNAFRAGLSDVINIEWLQMFDHRELQVLISGAQVAIDIDDLRANTNYSDPYDEEQPYIKSFWEILIDLTDHQKRQFLKFVTSCSRPPLLGFSELYPKFCIHYGGEEDRLPSASTCMNLLKLPRYETIELLKTRLVYAIESEAGFELS